MPSEWGAILTVNDRLVEILVSIVDRLLNLPERVRTVENLTEDLIAEGYSIGEINNALAWLCHSIDEKFFEEGRIVFDRRAKATLRMLNDYEKSMITPQAYGYILQLSQLGLLDDLQIEELIERAIYTSVDPVEVSDLKRMVPSIILESAPGSRSGLISWQTGGQEGSLAH